MPDTLDDAPSPPNASPSQKSLFTTFLRSGSWAALVLGVLIIGGAWIAGSRLSGNTPEALPKAGAQVGLIAPDFVLATLDGKVVSLSSQRDKVVLINLWASWCGPCRSEMPAINRVYAKYRDAGFVVLAVNATAQDNESDARSFVQAQGLTFPVLLDRDGSASRNYRLRVLPTSYFVGRDGFIRDSVVSSMSEAMLEARVKRLLAGGR